MALAAQIQALDKKLAAQSQIQEKKPAAFNAYRTWFANENGRSPEEGMPGRCSKQPAVSPDMLQWGIDRWAAFWLLKGGFETAEQRDDQGWTALHHAAHAMVYWE